MSSTVVAPSQVIAPCGEDDSVITASCEATINRRIGVRRANGFAQRAISIVERGNLLCGRVHDDRHTRGVIPSGYGQARQDAGLGKIAECKNSAARSLDGGLSECGPYDDRGQEEHKAKNMQKYLHFLCQVIERQERWAGWTCANKNIIAALAIEQRRLIQDISSERATIPCSRRRGECSRPGVHHHTTSYRAMEMG
jgi:hypothetical protein